MCTNVGKIAIILLLIEKSDYTVYETLFHFPDVLRVCVHRGDGICIKGYTQVYK